MVHEKPDAFESSNSLPIPSYDEAINSRPSSSQSFLGPQEVSHDAERQGLLGRREGSALRGYQRPTAESVRSSMDDLLSSGDISREGSTEDLRRELQQMDIIEPSGHENSNIHLLTNSRLSKRFTNFTHSLSSIHLPFRQWLPSWDYIKAKAGAFPFRGLAVNWILLFRLFALVLVVFIIYLLFISDLFKIRKGPGRMPSDPERLRTFVMENIQPSSIREFSRYLTSYDHMAGTAGSLSQAEFIEKIFTENNLEEVGLERFDVYLNFPKKGGRKVAIVEPVELTWEAKIEEEPAFDDGRQQVPVFHGHSKTGNVTGPLIVSLIRLRSVSVFLNTQTVCKLWVAGGFRSPQETRCRLDELCRACPLLRDRGRPCIQSQQRSCSGRYRLYYLQ